MGIVADHVGAQAGAIGHPHGAAVGPLDHVAVGQYEAVGRENDAGAARLTAFHSDDRGTDRLDGLCYGEE